MGLVSIYRLGWYGAGLNIRLGMGLVSIYRLGWYGAGLNIRTWYGLGWYGAGLNIRTWYGLGMGLVSTYGLGMNKCFWSQMIKVFFPCNSEMMLCI